MYGERLHMWVEGGKGKFIKLLTADRTNVRVTFFGAGVYLAGFPTVAVIMYSCRGRGGRCWRRQTRTFRRMFKDRHRCWHRAAPAVVVRGSRLQVLSLYSWNAGSRLPKPHTAAAPPAGVYKTPVAEQRHPLATHQFGTNGEDQENPKTLKKDTDTK